MLSVVARCFIWRIGKLLLLGPRGQIMPFSFVLLRIKKCGGTPLFSPPLAPYICYYYYYYQSIAQQAQCFIYVYTFSWTCGWRDVMRFAGLTSLLGVGAGVGSEYCFCGLCDFLFLPFRLVLSFINCISFPFYC